MILKRVFKAFNSSISQRFIHNSNKYFKPPFSESLLHENGKEGVYAEQMYESWQKDHNSVHASWDTYFSKLEHGEPIEQPAEPTSKAQQTFQVHPEAEAEPGESEAVAAARDALRLRALILSYLARGHEKADVDPLRKTCSISNC